jgi:Protein of unknown function (DUF1592)/Protein of unknown function (DUF1588)/Protein of unknown function (DUF1595)/Protein of unknown function (DUF1587)/Protein of unknown function (DUF1585)
MSRTTRSSALLFIASLLVAGLAGCNSDSTMSSDATGSSTTAPGSSPSAPGASASPPFNADGTPATPPSVPLPAGVADVQAPVLEANNTAMGVRRLSAAEYRNSVRDLLGVALDGITLPEPSLVHSLSNNQHVMQVARGDAEAIEAAAGTLATRALPKLKLPTGCSTTSMPTDCIDRFLPGFLQRAYRRPATAAETKRMKDLFTALGTDGTSEALRGVVQATLMAPSFVYRFEIGTAQGALGPYELASRLSYLLWGSMPDDALLAAAAANALRTPEQIKAQVTRMLTDARARQGVVQFVRDWLGTAKANVLLKGADLRTGLNEAALQADLESEHVAFIGEALLGTGGSVSSLLAGKFTYVSASGAKLQGLPAVTSLQRVSLEGTQRRGVLTQPLLLVAHTKEAGVSLVQMGRFVRENVLCQPVAPPPPGVPTSLPNDPASANLSFRERFANLTAPSPCIACHQSLNPPGFAYLAFDPLGRFLAADGRGVPFDTTGVLPGLDRKSVSFTGAAALAENLAASTDARSCFTRRLIEYGFGRNLAQADTALYLRLARQLVVKDDFPAFLTDLLASPEFASAGPRS